MSINRIKAQTGFLQQSLKKTRSLLKEDKQGIDQPNADELARQIVTDLGRGSNHPFYGMNIKRLGDTASLEANFGVRENSEDSDHLVKFKLDVDESDITFYVNGEEVATCGRGQEGYPEALQSTMQALYLAQQEATDSAKHGGNPGYGDYEPVDNEFSEQNTEEE